MDGKRYKYYRSLEYETVLRKERETCCSVISSTKHFGGWLVMMKLEEE